MARLAGGVQAAKTRGPSSARRRARRVSTSAVATSASMRRGGWNGQVGPSAMPPGRTIPAIILHLDRVVADRRRKIPEPFLKTTRVPYNPNKKQKLKAGQALNSPRYVRNFSGNPGAEARTLLRGRLPRIAR